VDVVDATHAFPEVESATGNGERRIGNVCDIPLDDILAAVCRSGDIDAHQGKKQPW